MSVFFLNFTSFLLIYLQFLEISDVFKYPQIAAKIQIIIRST